MSSSHVSRASSSAVNLEVRHNHAPHRQSNMFPPASFPGDTEAKPAGRTFESKPRPVTWLSLPRKGQLFILFLCRLVDFLQVASLQAYMFYQLKSFDIGLPDTTISYQAGVLQGCFTGAQVATAMLWGKAADSSSGGRKLVLLVGLVGTAVSCLGYGFATTFASALWWRAFGGAINGTVGTVRTMISEITKEKKYQSRAFLILPMSFNVAGILGPVTGGLLADPATTLPGLFGPQAVFGMKWLQEYPYALPGVLNALFVTIAAAFVFFGLEETLKTRRGKFDLGLSLSEKIWNKIPINLISKKYSLLIAEPTPVDIQTFSPDNTYEKAKSARPGQILPFQRIWTRNVVFTLITTAFFDFHLGAFTNLWSLFLSTPRSSNTLANPNSRTLPFIFSGGLGMPASTVGIATSILGILGMALQIFLYPSIQERLGTLLSFRYFLYLFPIAYFVAPYLSVLPSSTLPPDPASGFGIWAGITIVLLLQVTARTFALPATIILLNNCSPHPSVLGTIHGLGQSVSATFRTVGPIVAGWWFGAGLDKGIVGAAWWGTAGVAGAGCVTALWVYEGSGHEIFLPGEGMEDDDDEVMLRNV